MKIEREINLAAMMEVMWERGKKILIFTLVTSIFGLLVSFAIPNRYGAQAIVVMNSSKLGLRIMEKPVFNLNTYMNLINADATLKKIIDDYKLNKSPYKLKYPENLKSRIGISMISPGANLMSIYVELEDATVAAKVSNELAMQAIIVCKKIMNNEKEVNASTIQEEVNKRLVEVDTNRKIYLDMLQKNLKPVFMKRLDTNMTVLATYRQEKETLDGSLIELENQLDNFKTLFSGTALPRIIDTTRNIIMDGLAMESVRKMIGGNLDPSLISRLDFKDQTVNTGYILLLQEYSKLKVDYPARKEKRDFMVKRIKELETEVEKDQKELFLMDVQEQAAKAYFDTSMEVYSGVAKQAGWAGTTVGTERQDLVLIHEAIPKSKKVYPPRTILVGLVGSLAFLLSFLYFLLTDLYGLLQVTEPKK